MNESSHRGLCVRAEVVGSEPLIWRDLEIPAQLRLNRVHDLLQVVFGWTDSHLHRFVRSDFVWDGDAPTYLCPYDLEEAEDEGTATTDVSIGELLVDTSSRLSYLYDYGDEWIVLLTLTASHENSSLRARVVGGEGCAPPDDFGGIGRWNESRKGPDFDVDKCDVLVATWTATANR